MKKSTLLSVFLVALFSISFMACQEKSPKEEVKENLEEVGEDIEEGLDDAGEAIEEAAEDTKEGVEDALDNAEEAVEGEDK